MRNKEIDTVTGSKDSGKMRNYQETKDFYLYKPISFFDKFIKKSV
jgi:hypothetical protein